MNQSMNQIKSESVFIAKTIGILAVILGHIANPFGSFIFSWHMPLFFFLAGCFFNNNVINVYDYLWQFFRKNLKKVAIPYFMFGILGIIIELLKRYFTNRMPESIFDILAGLFYWMDMPHMNHYGFVLWFLPALFWTKMVSAFFIQYIKNKAIIIIMGVILFFYFSYSKILLPFCLDIGLLSIIWCVLSVFISDKIFSNSSNNKWVFIASMITLLLIKHPALDLAHRYFENPIYNLFYSLLLIFIVLQISIWFRFFMKFKIVKLWATNTMFILGTHVYTNNIAHLVVNKFFSDLWILKFLISLVFLSLLLLTKEKCVFLKVQFVSSRKDKI